MADVTASVLSRNAGAAITVNDGAASQTIVYDRADEKIAVIVSNTDAAECSVKFTASGTMAGGTDLSVGISASAEKAVVLESARFKAASTGKVTAQVLSSTGTTFSGTVSLVKFRVIKMPKGLID